MRGEQKNEGKTGEQNGRFHGVPGVYWKGLQAAHYIRMRGA